MGVIPFTPSILQSQITQRTHHSSTSVRRYVQTFLRIVLLYRQDFAQTEIAHLAQVSEPLLAEYLTLYEQYDEPIYRQRLERHLKRLQAGLRLDEDSKKGGL